MKSVKIVIASLIAIALMVTPIALFATDNTESEAANYQELSDIFDDIDWEKLMGLDYSKPSIAGNEEITGNVSVEGTHKFLEKNYTFTDGATLTVKNGASLTICPTQTFSFSSTGWGGIILEEGSHIYITTNGAEPVTGESGNVIASYDVEDDTPNWFTGSFGYTHNPYESVINASNDTVISNSKVAAEQIAKIEFTKDNSFSLKIVKAEVEGEKTTVDITLKSDIGVKTSVFVDKDRTIVYDISGTTDYVANAEMQTSAKQNDYKFTLKGSNELNLTLDDDYGGTITDKADFTITATVNNETKDTVTKMTGSLSLELDTKNMEDYEATPNMTITVKNAKAKYALDFDNDTVTGTADMSMGTYKIVAKSETGDVTSEMKDVSIYGKYVGKFSFNDIGELSIPTVQKQKGTIDLDDYYSGIVPGMSSSEVRSYAAEFFLGSFDKAYHLDQSGLTTTSLDAEVKCGSANINGYTVSGLTASLEIDDSVGLKATGKVDSLIVQSESKTNPTAATKFYLGSADFTLATDTSGKSMFTCDFSGSVQEKNYVSGKAVEDLYAKDVKATMTIGKTNKLTSLTAGEVAMGVNGVYLKANNVTLDTDWQAFLIDKVTISGNYYGDAEVKSVEGSWSDVVLYTNKSLSAKSADMRINDVDGDYVQFTRTYDSTTKTITNTYKVTGQVNMKDILDDGTLGIFMNVPISGAVNPKVVNYFEGEAIVAAGSSYELYSLPGVVIADKKINVMSGYSVFVQLSAPSEVYVTNYPHNTKGAIKVGDVTTTVQLDGAALGLVMDAEGAISYKLIACPGYTLSSTMTYSGMTLSNITDSSADATLTASAVSCEAIPMQYNIKLDGSVVKENVKYGTHVSIENAFPDGDVLYVVDENGAKIGNVVGKDWEVTYYYTKDLDIKTVKGKEVTEFADAGKVNVIDDASSVKFAVPSGQTAMKFQLSSKVRFDLSGLSQDDNIELVAQPTKFDGKDAFIIKATNDGYTMGATIYIPFSGEGKRLIHVDEYGRTMELESTVVSIDGDNYLKATVSDYSIFYADSDDSPVIPSKGSSTNWLLIGIGIAAAVIIIAGAVVFIKKR